MELQTAVAHLPKVELHVHLEGSIRPATVLALAERNGVDLGVGSEAELAAQRVRWAEVTTTPFRHVHTKGWGEAADPGVEVRWILDVSPGQELPDDQLTASILTGLSPLGEPPGHLPDVTVAVDVN
jgi:aminodeoxyfutalosine deaminase